MRTVLYQIRKKVCDRFHLVLRLDKYLKLYNEQGTVCLSISEPEKFKNGTVQAAFRKGI